MVRFPPIAKSIWQYLGNLLPDDTRVSKDETHGNIKTNKAAILLFNVQLYFIYWITLKVNFPRIIEFEY